MGLDRVARFRRLGIELRMLILFGGRTVIRDADAVNHIDLLDMLQRNSGGIRAGFECGALVFGIREFAESLSEVNEQAHENRAFPERFAQAKARLITVESWLAERGLTLVQTATSSKDTFSEHLHIILNSGRLLAEDEDVLRDAMEIARNSSAGEGPLRFGHVIREAKQRGASEELIQWCRAAHVLVAPAEHGLPPSTVDQDLRPDMAALLCRCKDTPKLARRWSRLYPRRILTEDTLLSLPFDEIVRMRNKGNAGYFDAVRNVQLAFGTAGFEHAYGDYLEALAGYIEAIEADHSVEMIDWQKALLDQRVEVEEEKWKVSLGAIPVVMGILQLFTVSRLPGLISTFASGAGIARSAKGKMKPSALVRLQRGTTITP
jgi:hypothetical protein